MVTIRQVMNPNVVALGPETPPHTGTAAPYLIDGRWAFRDMRRRDCGFSVMARGYGTGQMNWGGLRPGSYQITAFDNNDQSWEDVADVGADGILALTVDADAVNNPVTIEVNCLGPGGRR